MTRIILFLSIGILVGSLTFTSEAELLNTSLHYETEVRPIMKAMCFQCHGEEAELHGGLDVRLVRLLTKGGESGAAIVPGSSSNSLLWRRIESDEMPEGAKYAVRLWFVW